MITLTINIENEKKLSGLIKYLDQHGLTYYIEQDYNEALEESLNGVLKIQKQEELHRTK